VNLPLWVLVYALEAELLICWDRAVLHGGVRGCTNGDVMIVRYNGTAFKSSSEHEYL
jgi:hypothetical protein